ncbi:hypothetical protein N665_0007s0008 [Sinapis alba]|nr:hypothetical protein N665_0007s0008 [Sinapis alba]
MAKTRWTRKKKMKLVKECEILKSIENENEEECEEDEGNEKEANPVENGGEESDENAMEEEERSEEEETNPVEDAAEENDENAVKEAERYEEEEANSVDENPVEEEDRSGEEEGDEKSDDEQEEEQQLEDVNSENNSNGENVQIDEEEGSASQTSSERSDSVDGALKPLAMYFPPSEYRKKIKISTRCYIADVMKTLKELDPPMSTLEKSWFENHPQFKHIFHMSEAGNHKVMGMWMLLLRTTRIAKEKKAWFTVNGCPIRYGIREHALISGLNCRNYPLDYNLYGGTEFVTKCFGGGIIRYQDVKAKVLSEMEPSRDRLRLLVWYFLSSVIVGQRKTGDDAPSVEPFLLRAVDDLNLCKTFPCGRLSFDYMMRHISHTMNHFEGKVKNEGVIWPIPCFCILMELLAFEAIAKLGEILRGRSRRSPNMSKNDIENILSVSEEEQTLLDRITEPEDIRDKDDLIVQSWMKRLAAGYVVRFEDMLAKDVAAREAHLPQNGGMETGATNEAAGNTVKVNELVQVFNMFKEDIGEWITRIEEKVGEFDLRLAASEAFVQEQLEAMKGNATVEKEDIRKRPRKKSKRKCFIAFVISILSFLYSLPLLYLLFPLSESSLSLSLFFSPRLSRILLSFSMEVGSGSSTRSRNSGRRRCFCGLPATISQAWTDKNPGRRFYGCPRYKLGDECKYFAWFDEEEGTTWQKKL